MINLSFEVQKAIVNVLALEDPESRLLYLKSINNVSGRGTENSKYTQKWDNKYNSVIEIADKFNLSYFKLKRGNLWEAILLMGKDDDLYVFFSEKNLNTIMNKDNKNHYLTLLNLFNRAYDDMKPIQISLPILDEVEDLEDRLEVAHKMLETMEKKPQKVIVFAFDNKFHPSVNAYAFNTRQEKVWEEDLTYLIDSTYRLVLEDDKIKPTTRESTVSPEIKREREKQNLVHLKV